MKRRNVIFLIISIVWMALIFWLSSRTADQSNVQSNGFILAFIPQFIVDLIPDFIIILLVRKSAHFALYFVLGIFYFLTTEQKSGALVFPVCLSEICAMSYAASDEIHQVFVEGRSGQFSDIALDSAGAMLGILLCALVIAIIRRKKKNEE